MSRAKLDENRSCSEPCKEGKGCGSTSSIPLFAASVNRVSFFPFIERAQKLFASGSVTGAGESLPFLQWHGRVRHPGKITEYGPRRQAAVAFLSRSDRLFKVLCRTCAASRSFSLDALRFSASADLCTTETKLRCPCGCERRLKECQ